MGKETASVRDSGSKDPSDNVEYVSLAEIFDRVVKAMKDIPQDENVFSREEKLQLYGRYKQVMVGNCPDNRAPSIFQVEAHAKYNAWQSCHGMSDQRAMKEYLEIISRSKHVFLSDLCRKSVADVEARQETNKQEAISAQLENGNAKSEPDLNKDNESNKRMCQTRPEWRRKRLFGINPLIPRGQLDISYFDLAMAALYCFTLSKSSYNHYEKRIREKWESVAGGSIPVVGFSVRTLLDLYLRCRQFPPDSEIIITPPITVPGMIHVLEQHQLKVIGVDLPADEDLVVGVDCDAVKSAITSKTAAIMVVHAFGMLTATERQMEELRSIADSQNLELWEDCAETFVGLGNDCYLGNPKADLRFFSFGLIKTCTAGGGGVFLCRDYTLSAKMERLYRHLYDQQTRLEFLFTISKMFAMKTIANSHYLYGLLAAILVVLGVDLDDFVTYLSRSFVARNRNNERVEFCPVLAKIRRRPSVPLLALLGRKFSRATSPLESVILKKARSSSLDAIFTTSHALRLPRPAQGASSTCWLYPICHNSPEKLCHVIRAHGFDLTRGATQLRCVSSCEDTPRCYQLMNRIVYIPNSLISEDDIRHLAELIQLEASRPITEHLRPSTGFRCIVFGIFCLSLFVSLRMSLMSLFGLVIFAIKGIIVVLSLVVLMLTAIRHVCAPYYLSSKALARFPWMVTEKPGSSEWRTRGKSILRDMPELARPTSVDSNRRSKIILTGATGFIGSMLLYDLLKDRMSLGVETVILFCRKKRNVSAENRIKELLRKPMFAFATETELFSCIRVIEYDLAKASSGISETDMKSLIEDHSISHIFNCAASVGFNQSLPVAAKANITPSLLLQNLAARINPKCKFIHLSTAFVHGDQTGTSNAPLQQQLFDFGRFDVNEIYRSMVGTQFYASKAMQKLGFPNTYTLSKSVCEHLLTRHAAAETTIIRPSIVGPALESPWESWAGDKPSTLVGAASLYFSYQGSLWPYSRCTIPCIPVDVVSRYIIAKAFADKRQTNDLSVSGSSCGEGIEKIVPCMSDSGATFSGDSDGFNKCAIYTAAWDSRSTPNDFSWLDFAASVFQFGVVVGYFSSLTAYTSILFTILLQGISSELFQSVHLAIVQIPHRMVLGVLSFLDIEARAMVKASHFLDLPVVFFPFMTRTFSFHTEITTPVEFDSERYLFTCAVAAAGFVEVEKGSLRRNEAPCKKRSRLELLGGSAQLPSQSDLFWVITQPNGNFAVRIAAWLIVKLLRACFDEVTADVIANGQLLSELKKRKAVKRIVLAPTHRSFFDFILISFVCFAIPELHIQLPKIAAADDFKGLFCIGWVVKYLGAFFVRRGVGKSNPLLNEQLLSLDSTSDDRLPVFEVFVEGARSRDRRFVKPRTGFLRALSAEGETVVVPMCISYEAIAEQAELSDEAATGTKARLSLTGTLRWVKDALREKRKLGKAHIVVGEPIFLGPQGDSAMIAREIQRHQNQLVTVSDYHLSAGALVLNVSKATLKECLHALGCRLWPESKTLSSALLPQDSNQLWTIFLQAAPYLEPLVRKSDCEWAKWLNSDLSIEVDRIVLNEMSCLKVAHELRSYFRACESVVDGAVEQLRGRNFLQPKPRHVLQTAISLTKECCPLLLVAAITHHSDLSTNLGSEHASLSRAETVNLPLQSGECLGFWGFPESRFIMKVDLTGNPLVTLDGSRYALSGKTLYNLVPFIEQEMSVNLAACKTHAKKAEAVCSESVLFEHFNLLKSLFSFVSYDCEERIRHGTGHSQSDVFDIRFGGDFFRVPDVVIWPKSEVDVKGIISLAKVHKWCIIPFGGGTNVTQATKCPPVEQEPRPIVSVDMTKMNKITRVDEENGYVEVEAGITGRKLVEDLRKLGYTMGHEPDSYEFSTLGGWIATKASGMKRSKYGNIEDIVLTITVVNARGILDDTGRKFCVGRVSCGPELRNLMFGSEGCLGIIVKASVRIWRLPQCCRYDSFLMPDFATGVNFAREVSRLGSTMPASVRVLDNDQFRLGQALQPKEDSSINAFGRLVKKMIVHALWHFEDRKVCCATIKYEGRGDEVRNQKKIVSQLAHNFCAVSLGPSVGKTAYEMTFMSAYLRDFALTYSILGESFETFAPWSAIEDIIDTTKGRIRREFKDRCLPGKPFIGCRITQLYHEGVCLYFYFCMSFDGINNPNKIFDEIENSARRGILDFRGSLSHHHGLGKVRSHLLKELHNESINSAILSIKNGLDPENLFGARNGLFANPAD